MIIFDNIDAGEMMIVWIMEGQLLQ